MKIIKQWVVVFALFLAALTASAQSHVPTTGSNNVWTGTNNFLYHSFQLNQGVTCASIGAAGQAMVGYATDLTPICAAFSGSGGVSMINGVTGAAVLDNTDGKISITPSGQNIHINCPGCGSGGTPSGGNGSIQTSQSGAFSGTVVTGLVKGNGTANPSAAVPDTDFALPFTITCSTGLTCPEVGHAYTFTLTGSAGTGAVASASFGQVGAFATAGTTIGGAPALYTLNPSWSLTQMNALFTRFNYVNVTNCSIVSNVATLTGANAYSVGDSIFLGGFQNCYNLNGHTLTVLSAGLSQTQFEVSISAANASGTENAYTTLSSPGGTVIIPSGLADSPSTAFNNTSGQVVDTRKKYWFQQLSQYGAKCDDTTLYVTLTAGSNLVNVGSSFNVSPIGMTLVVGQQVGYGNMGLQQDWTPTVYNFVYPNLIMSSNAPFTYTGFVDIGTNNQAAIQRAFNDVAGSVPLWIPQCHMLTDTIRWGGQSLIGTAMNYSVFRGFPGHDVFQSQDSSPITAWSINSGTGVTTFTIPSYSAHHILATSDYPAGSNVQGDSILLSGFPTSTFFNGQTVTIATHPTPTTFTVNSVFGQSTSSATESGVAGATTSVNNTGMLEEQYSVAVNNSIDPSFKWNHYDATGTLTVQPAYSRPLEEFTRNANNPFGPGWGVGQVNGIANITQNSATACVSTTVVGGNTPRVPVVGTKFLLPYQGAGEFSTTVSSIAGSTCGAGYVTVTLAAATPNTAAFTATGAEWFTFTTAQTLATSMPSSITLPYTITLSVPFPPVPVYETDVSSHGHIIINNDEWDYMGITFGGTAGGNPTMVLRNGPAANCNATTGVCSVNSGAGNNSGSVVFPLNPCQPFYDNPYPVTPTLTTQATPIRATYYPGLCGGNAAFSSPGVDGLTTQFGSNSPDIAHFIDVQGLNTSVNALGNADNNGSMVIYEQANNTGYGNTYDGLRGEGLWGGFMQGPATVNQYYVASIGPTSTGQAINNCTWRTGYAFSLVSMEQSKINRCDTYTTETSPYDGTTVGASTGLHIGYTVGEQYGNGITGVGQFTIEDYNSEPENGNHEELPPSVQSDGTNITWSGTIFEGGFNIFGGGFQIVHGTQMSPPIFNYGSSNYFEHLYGIEPSNMDSNVYNNTNNFFNWGNFSTCQTSTGQSGPLRNCGVGFVQDYNGHDAWATMMGNLAHPTENILGGMILPQELAQGMVTPTAFDSTELWWGKYSECSIGPGQECIAAQFDEFNGYIFIGPHQRIADAPTVIKANVRLINSGTASFRLLIGAQDPGGTGCSPNYSLTTGTFTVTNSSWTQIQLPVDFTGTKGCTLAIQFDTGSSSNTLAIGYFNFVPFASQLFMPLGTPTQGAACPVAGEFKMDYQNEWLCHPASGSTFGAGVWGHVPIT